jgi:beta-glucosidase
VSTDTRATFKERAAELVSQMTLEEKVSQMVFDAPAIERLGVPAYNWWNEGLHGVGRAGVATICRLTRFRVK